MENFIMGALVALISVAFGFIGCFFLCRKVKDKQFFIEERLKVIDNTLCIIVEKLQKDNADSNTNKSDEHFKTQSGLLSWKKVIPSDE